MPWAVALIALAISVTGWLANRPVPSNTRAVARWRIPVPSGASVMPPGIGLLGPALAISPNGRHIAYVVTREDVSRLYLKTGDTLDAIPVHGAEYASVPFFSADSQSLGFQSADGTLMRVSLYGGAPVAIGESGAYIRGASWSADGNITFATGLGELRRLPATGGSSDVLAVPDRARAIKSFQLPEALPGGEAVLLGVADPEIDLYDHASVAAFWPKTGEMRVLVHGGTNARYSPSGHLVYARAGALYAVPFDVGRVEVTGDPVRVLEGVAAWPTIGPAQFSVSHDGSLLYAPGKPMLTHHRIAWVDRNGRATTLVEEPRPYFQPSISPDGRALAVHTDYANPSLWRYDIAQGSLTRIASGGYNGNPTWTPDGARIAFTSDRDGSQSLYSIPADGSGPPQKLLDRELTQYPLSWTPDGEALLFEAMDATGSFDLWLLTSDGETVPVLATSANETSGEIAPDGKWMAYQSDESGRPEIYVCAFPSAESIRRVSVDGGIEPRWNPNGRELIFRSGNEMMAVEVSPGDALALGRPQLLFTLDDYYPFVSYDVSPDGEHFVMIDTSEEPRPPTELVLVQNWAEELKRLVPTN